jgi:bis(5'-adenosyl)-triphosphatase
MTTKADCPFCHADIKRSVFAEEGKFWAIYNIAPILPGHCLVIPKTHVGSVMKLSEEELGQFIIFARRVTKTILQTFDASGFDWAIQDAQEAGQTVPHLHMHIIPRTPNDLPNEGDWYAKLERSQAQAVDSKDRPHLTSEQLDHYVWVLRQAFKDSQNKNFT